MILRIYIYTYISHIYYICNSIRQLPTYYDNWINYNSGVITDQLHILYDLNIISDIRIGVRKGEAGWETALLRAELFCK